MASDIWLRTILIVRKETRCRHIGYSYRLTARVLLYAPSHRQDNTYHGLCYTSRGALAGARNSSMGWIIRDKATLTGVFECDILEYILNYDSLYNPKGKWISLWRFHYKNVEKLSMEIFYWDFNFKLSCIYFASLTIKIYFYKNYLLWNFNIWFIWRQEDLYILRKVL